MVDLSRVLGDVYSHSDEAAARPAPASTLPAPVALGEDEAWADDAHLDEAFRRWRPGPPREAPAAERMFVAHAARTDHVAPSPAPAEARPGLADGDAQPVAYVPGTPAAAFALLDDPTGTADAAGRSDVDGDSLSAAVADAFAQAVTAEMSGRPRWVRAHDDILPARGDRRRGLFRRR